MIANTPNTLFETTIRFLSFYTILTNTLVAVYFIRLSYRSLKNKGNSKTDFEILTAITVYITIVGLVYQILLRNTWSPTGMQKLVDELLHSVNPVLVILFWFLNRKNYSLSYSKIALWLVYPLVYLFYVLVRGYFSNFYPYPFIDVSTLGLSLVLVNSLGITLLFIAVSTFFIWLSGYINTQHERGNMG
jgi:hypothetical protein